jgi:hypothetical protein
MLLNFLYYFITGLANLVQCPACEFAVEIPDPEYKVGNSRLKVCILHVLHCINKYFSPCNHALLIIVHIRDKIY